MYSNSLERGSIMIMRHGVIFGLALAGVFAADSARAQSQQEMEVQGRRLYLQYNCYSCHGIHAQGGIGPNIQLVDAVNISEAVLGGEPGGMISFKKWFKTTQINEMAAYLAVAGTNQEPTFVNWWQVPPQSRRPK